MINILIAMVWLVDHNADQPIKSRQMIMITVRGHSAHNIDHPDGCTLHKGFYDSHHDDGCHDDCCHYDGCNDDKH